MNSLIVCMCFNSGTCSIPESSSAWRHHSLHLRATETFPELKYYILLAGSSWLKNFIDSRQPPLRLLGPWSVSSRWAPIPGQEESIHKPLFSWRSGTITKIYLLVNVPCLVNHWIVNLNNGTVPSLSNSIKVERKAMLKNTFQAEEYAIIVLDTHKLNNTSISLLGKRTLHNKHRVEKKQRQWFSDSQDD